MSSQAYEDLLGTMLEKSWVDIFIHRSNEPDIRDIISDIIKDFRLIHSGYNGCSFGKLDNKKKEVMFPSLSDIVAPFQMISAEAVSCVMLFGEPCKDGTDTGVPLLMDRINYPPLNDMGVPFYDNQIRDEQSITRHENMTRLVAASRVNSPYQLENTHLDWFKSGQFSIHNWITSGVLPMYSCWTTTNVSPKLHHSTYWFQFVVNILESLLQSRPEIPIITFGSNAASVAAALATGNQTFYFNSVDDKVISTSYDLSTVDRYLSDNSISTIQW
jgi:hypothetical protein